MDAARVSLIEVYSVLPGKYHRWLPPSPARYSATLHFTDRPSACAQLPRLYREKSMVTENRLARPSLLVSLSGMFLRSYRKSLSRPARSRSSSSSIRNLLRSRS